MRNQSSKNSREHGQAGAELALVLPLIVVMIVGMLVLGRLFYTHLALITATNDCVTAAAQAVRADSAYAQGNAARAQSLSTYTVPQDNPGGLAFSSDATCQTGYTLRDLFFFQGGGTWNPVVFTIHYEYSLPRQAYKSDWIGTIIGGTP